MDFKITLTRRYEMQVAHRLTAGVHEGHKCRRLHGHRYVLDVSVDGTVDDDGMLLEYEDIDKIIKPILRLIDHHDANTLSERCSTPEAAAVAANPTVERLLAWFFIRLRLLHSAKPGSGFCGLSRLVLEEDSRSRVEWSRP